MSFMYNIKSRELKIDPWGTPEAISRGVERALSTSMPWERPIKIARKPKKTGLTYAVSLKLV